MVAAARRIPTVPAEQYERQQVRLRSSEPELWSLLDTVKDPEIPVISIWESGILRGIERDGDTVVVTITPTYSGCPAMEAIEAGISRVLDAAGYADHRVQSRLAPARSTAWMTPEGRDKLRDYGIAPPGSEHPHCPHCGAEAPRLVSEFGSTSCKSLYTCSECGEPFDFFKSL